ncbi:MAG: class I SAM-dependent methyltransferase [Promethearchaeota archaeon]
MKEVNNVKYFNILEIVEFFSTDETKESIKNYFETKKLDGKKIDGEWHTTKENIEKLIEKIENVSITFSDPQEVDLSNIDLNGRILDIGGGGEGVIGQLKGNSVVAIDLRKSELEESLEAGDKESLKIIMDAKDLKFLDNTFNIVTAFFSLMYVPNTDHKQIFTEIYRVLKEDGQFLLWDLIIPKNIKKKQIFVVPIKIQIKYKEIITGYGIRWNKEQNLEYFIGLAKKVGFVIYEQQQEEEYFFLRLKKIRTYP